MQHMRPLLQNYIWQKEGFELTPSTSQAPPWARAQPVRRKKGAAAHAPESQDTPVSGDNSSQLAGTPPCLWGSLCWGENVEDEWFVVHLLLEMTKHISGLDARVSGWATWLRACTYLYVCVLECTCAYVCLHVYAYVCARLVFSVHASMSWHACVHARTCRCGTTTASSC